MIVPMKKISLITRADSKAQALKLLRKLGIVHIEIREGFGEQLGNYKEQIALLERAAFVIGKDKTAVQQDADTQKALEIANAAMSLTEEKSACLAELAVIGSELERIKAWGDIDPAALAELQASGVDLALCELSRKEYAALPASVQTVALSKTKASVKFLWIKGDGQEDCALGERQLALPHRSSAEMRAAEEALRARISEIDRTVASYTVYTNAMQAALVALEKEVELETYTTGMTQEELSDDPEKAISVAYFTGFVEAERLPLLKQTAQEHAWGLFAQDPTEEDNAPTKLKNNRLVSLIYPIMDFLGTVPGYFEYDISGWFLAFILIFFGIIFGDGGYGLLICAVALVPITKALISKKPISPVFLLVGLFGLSTVLWGTLTCTWFGLSPEQLPGWLQSLSIPFISNVYADKLWTLPWTADGVGLTTPQNTQIFCFTLALIQLTVAHLKGAARNRRSAKLLGDVGSILQLLGIYYLVLSLVVNPEVFTFGLVIGAVPVGTLAIALIGVGFVLSFVFSNYNGSLGRSVLASCKNIVSVLLGVVNVFSDIVSYIRLWAVGLAGAAISATVNELASPLLGNFMFMILAIVLLVFGHGLNMILNVLSVIVHGIRLNTLEFSSHLDMSWSGHKFKPFKE